MENEKEMGETIELKPFAANRLKQKYGDDVTVSLQGKAINMNVKNYEFTLIDDGTIRVYKDGYMK